MAHTSCFRREAGSAGKDTRGLLRAHEFDKVELLAVAADAEQAVAAQQDVLARSEALLRDAGPGVPHRRPVHRRPRRLGRPHVGHRGATPRASTWLELSSVSWFGDYQARRANIRYRPDGGKATEVAHTVNGSAMGWSRTVATYLETHRLPDGAIAIVEALRPYLGGAEAIPART